MAKNKKIKKPIKAIVVLCEGKTDVAFLRKLLEIDDYKDYKEIVSKMPKPLGLNGDKKGSYFVKKLKEYKYDSGKLHKRPILPIILRHKEPQSSNFLLLYSMDGMDKSYNYNEIITDFNKLTQPTIQDDFEGSLAKIEVALAFIYDLDDKTVTNRIEYIQKTYIELIPELKYLSESRQFTNSKNYKSIGYYFLGKDSEEAGGNLEDIILPLMKKGNEVVFQNAKTFLNSNGGFVRYKENNPSEKNENKTQSDFKKSLIGTVGQLEHSGRGNIDIIKKTSMLNKDKLKNSEQCQAIIKFFSEMRKAL